MAAASYVPFVEQTAGALDLADSRGADPGTWVSR